MAVVYLTQHPEFRPARRRVAAPGSHKAPQHAHEKAGPDDAATLSIWMRRIRQRRDLRRTIDQEPLSVLADAGYSLSSAWDEVRKPFWRA